jgi:AbrB family looped-hinge helix DNA binding protein
MAAIGTGRVQSRGQITLPKSVRNEANIHAGDYVLFKVLGPSRIEIETIPVKPLSYFLEKYRSDEPYDEDRIREEWQEEAARNVIGE